MFNLKNKVSISKEGSGGKIINCNILENVFISLFIKKTLKGRSYILHSNNCIFIYVYK